MTDMQGLCCCNCVDIILWLCDISAG